MKHRIRNTFQLDYGTLDLSNSLTPELFLTDHPNIIPSDMDGFMERNGHFLFWDYKTTKNPVPTGQDIAFRALSKQPNTTVQIIQGSNQESDKPGLYWFFPERYKEYRNGVLDKDWTERDLWQTKIAFRTWYFSR